MVNWLSIRIPSQVNGKSKVFPTNGVDKIGYPHAKEWNWNHINKN